MAVIATLKTRPLYFIVIFILIKFDWGDMGVHEHTGFRCGFLRYNICIWHRVPTAVSSAPVASCSAPSSPPPPSGTTTQPCVFVCQFYSHIRVTSHGS